MSAKDATVSSDTLQKRLRMLQIEMFSLAVAFPEPASAYKFQMEHLDNFCYEANVQQFGYTSTDAFLSDHPRLDTVMIGDRKCYRAKIQEKTADIQNMVAKQKKKKKTKKNPRNNLDRTVPFKRTALQSRTFSARSGVKQIEYARSSLRTSAASYVVPTHTMGVQRFMSALKSCNGTATLTRLNMAYMRLYKVQFDKNELMKNFGTRNLREIFTQHFVGLAELKVVSGSQYMFISQENIERQGSWSVAHNQIVIPEKVHCEIPSLAKLYKDVVSMLEDIYPSSIQLVNMTEAYQRNYKVLIDPEKAYCKSWRQLVSVTFKENLQLMNNGYVRLSDTYVASHKMTLKVPQVSQISSRRVTPADLGLEINSSDCDGEDESYYDGSASESTSVSHSYSDSSVPLSNIAVPCGINTSGKQTHLSNFGRCDPLRKGNGILRPHSISIEGTQSLANRVLISSNNKEVQDKCSRSMEDPLDRFRLPTANNINSWKHNENIGDKSTFHPAPSSITSTLVSSAAKKSWQIEIKEVLPSSHETTKDCCISSLVSSDSFTKNQSVNSISTKPKGFGFGGKVKSLLGLRGLSRLVKQIPTQSNSTSSNETNAKNMDLQPSISVCNDVTGIRNSLSEYSTNTESTIVDKDADSRTRIQKFGGSTESSCKPTQVHIPHSYFNVKAVNIGGKAQAKAAEIKRSMVGATIQTSSLATEEHF